MLLAIDLGTNALKAGLFDLNGHAFVSARRPYPLIRIGEHGMEQDPDEWWRATCEALGEIFVAHDASQVGAVCVIGQGPSLVVCDDALRARTPALTWADQRAHAERARLSEQFGYGVSVWSLLPKISWLHRERPDIFDEHTRVMQAYDFIAARLAGQSFASQFGGYPPFSADEFALLVENAESSTAVEGIADRIIQAFGEPFLLTQFVGLALFLVASQAELTQTPFDMPVAESELVAGYMVEYTGFRFLFFFIGEFGTAFAFAAIAATLFLGGWAIPGVHGDWANILGPPVLFAKLMIIAFFMFWVRFTYPRLREDQLQAVAWKFLIPLGLANILLTGLFKVAF